ncbi:MAG: phosphoadenosine phosphosulfate reductase family protein [Pseudomonadota bacterium]
MTLTREQFEAGNLALADADPETVIDWILRRVERPMVTTSFGRHSAVLLDMVVRRLPNIPVVWVDHGFNTTETYRFARRLIERLDLNMQIYAPLESPAWITATLGGVPDVGEPLHEDFTRRVKLEPFERALAELKPDAWLTGIRGEETALRGSLGRLSMDGRGLLKVAPLIAWRESDCDTYLARRDLPSEPNYFDPTKGLGNRECGLHRPGVAA